MYPKTGAFEWLEKISEHILYLLLENESFDFEEDPKSEEDRYLLLEAVELVTGQSFLDESLDERLKHEGVADIFQKLLQRHSRRFEDYMGNSELAKTILESISPEEFSRMRQECQDGYGIDGSVTLENFKKELDFAKKRERELQECLNLMRR